MLLLSLMFIFTVTYMEVSYSSYTRRTFNLISNVKLMSQNINVLRESVSRHLYELTFAYQKGQWGKNY